METLQNYDFWQIALIMVAIFAVAKGLFEGIMWVLDKLNIYHNARSKSEKLESQLKENTDKTEEIRQKLDKTQEIMQEYFNIEKIQFRHSIVRAAEDYISRGWIYSYELESIEDMYSVYKNVLKGNSYVSTLMEKIRDLEIRQSSQRGIQ